MATIVSRPAAGKASFHHVAAPFLDQPGLPSAGVLSARQIEQAFAQEGALFATDAVFSIPVVLWAFLAQALRDGKAAASDRLHGGLSVGSFVVAAADGAVRDAGALTGGAVLTDPCAARTCRFARTRPARHRPDRTTATRECARSGPGGSRGSGDRSAGTGTVGCPRCGEAAARR
jgi:hypothetical protein